MDTRLFWVPGSGWCRTDVAVTREEPKPFEPINPFVQPDYGDIAPWPAVGLSYPQSVSSCGTWYASIPESDSLPTSDLSPASGYFDWSHSSNSTSPLQCDHQSSPGTVPHPDTRTGTGRQSSFVADYPNFRGTSCHTVSNALSCPYPTPLDTASLGPKTLTAPAEHHPSALPPSLVSPSPKREPSSTSIVKEVADHANSPSSRSGKPWKAAHRAVERRYRSNLNLKIAKLGQCIPAIRNQAAATPNLGNGSGSRPATKAKLQKGHVLSKALDYIHSLNQHVSELEAERNQLKSRVEALDVLLEGKPNRYQEIPACGKAAEVPRRYSKPQLRQESRAKKGSSSVVESETLGKVEFALLLEARNRNSDPQNEVNAVSEAPSPAPKRPQLTRTTSGITRISAS